MQSRLLTRHVVFLGYSLADDNFVRHAGQVRQLLRGRRRSKVGTVLTLGPEPARERLWREDLAHVSAVASIRDDDPLPAARELEILLDRLAWAARGGLSYILDEHYRELTDPGTPRWSTPCVALRRREPLLRMRLPGSGSPWTSY